MALFADRLKVKVEKETTSKLARLVAAIVRDAFAITIPMWRTLVKQRGEMTGEPLAEDAFVMSSSEVANRGTKN